MASRYDDELWELAHVRDHPPGARADWVASLEPARHALDLGCGDGALSPSIRADRLTLADVSAVALSRAQARMPDAERAELEPDAPLPFPDGAFDLVVCAETLEHVRDVQLLLSELRRVLRPGGALAITTPAYSRLTAARLVLRGWESLFEPLSPHLRFFTRRSLARLLDELGFDVTSLSRRAGTLLALASRA